VITPFDKLLIWFLHGVFQKGSIMKKKNKKKATTTTAVVQHFTIITIILFFPFVHFVALLVPPAT